MGEQSARRVPGQQVPVELQRAAPVWTAEAAAAAVAAYRAGMPLLELAERHAVAVAAVRRAVLDADVPLAAGDHSDDHDVVYLYRDRQLTKVAAAQLLGISTATVTAALNRTGTPSRPRPRAAVRRRAPRPPIRTAQPDGAPPRPRRRVDTARILELYRAGSTQAQVAEQLAISRSTVGRVVRAAGVPTAKNPAPLDRDVVTELYTVRQLSHAQIAEHLGVPLARVRRALADAGLPTDLRRGRKVNDVDVAARFQAGESTAELAADYGVHVDTIRSSLTRSSVPRRRARPDPEALAAAYRAGASITAVAEQFAVAGRVVSEALDLLEVPRHRTALPKDEVVARYHAGEPLSAIAERYGASLSGVWRVLQRAGALEPTARPTLTVRQILELYGRDRLTVAEVAPRTGAEVADVEAAMVSAGIPLPGDPVDDGVVARLYRDFRLTLGETAHLTGRSEPAVRRALEATGTPVRRGRPRR